jgi:hypothetical protein
MNQLSMTYPSAVVSRRSGLRRARHAGETLRERYLALLAKYPDGLTDQDAASLLGPHMLSTTVGARRKELMTAQPGLIESCGRVTQPNTVSRTKWKLSR